MTDTEDPIVPYILVARAIGVRPRDLKEALRLHADPWAGSTDQYFALSGVRRSKLIPFIRALENGRVERRRLFRISVARLEARISIAVVGRSRPPGAQPCRRSALTDACAIIIGTRATALDGRGEAIQTAANIANPLVPLQNDPSDED